MMAKEVTQRREASMSLPSGTDRIVTSDTRTVITESFVKAGPWAILSMILILGLGWEVHYFIGSYVNNTSIAINESNKVQQQLLQISGHTSELIRQNGAAIEMNSQALLAMMKHAQQQMEPVAADRRNQTELLKQILAELKASPR